MSTQLPNNLHDLAWWLYTRLEGVRTVGPSGVWEGRLPDSYDYAAIVGHIENVDEHQRLLRNGSPAARLIEVNAGAVGVYRTIEELVRVAANRRSVPSRFTIIDPYFSFDEAFPPPDEPSAVSAYKLAVGLWDALSDLADIKTGSEVIFVESRDATLTVSPAYEARNLRELASFPQFAAEYFRSATHVDQKKSIVRASIVEHFKPKRKVTLADILDNFDGIEREVRRSYAMYAREFSYKKTRDDVERQNVDDMLRLNKTVAEIQNQLLAIPAAVLLAGTTLSSGADLKNLAVLLGMWVFCTFMTLLVSNQRNSVQAINSEMAVRKASLAKLPDDVSAGLVSLFRGLDGRVLRQNCVLSFIAGVVYMVGALTTVAVVWLNYGSTLQRLVTAAWNSVIEQSVR